MQMAQSYGKLSIGNFLPPASCHTGHTEQYSYITHRINVHNCGHVYTTVTFTHNLAKLLPSRVSSQLPCMPNLKQVFRKGKLLNQRYFSILPPRNLYRYSLNFILRKKELSAPDFTGGRPIAKEDKAVQQKLCSEAKQSFSRITHRHKMLSFHVQSDFNDSEPGYCM